MSFGWHAGQRLSCLHLTHHPSKTMLMHTNFERAFTHDLVVPGNGETLRLSVERGAPFTLHNDLVLLEPGDARVQLRVSLVPGTYAPEASIARAGDNAVVAALRVIKTGTSVTSWHDVGTLSCDGGWLALATRAEAVIERDGLWSASPEMVASQAGFGDGGYGVFIGKDARGEAVACVIDYFVLVGPVVSTITLPARGRITHDSGVTIDVGGDHFVRIDTTQRTSDEVTDFKLHAFAATGEAVFVGYSTQGGIYVFEAPDVPVTRLELSFQTGVVAL